MKNQEQKEYEAPQTTCLEVELEQGFMKASVFEDGTENAEHVVTVDHEVNSTIGNYFNNSGEGISSDWNTWDE